jgi:2-polyprenyl-3-methyl-5-hydroxy-6-metoxy-1,4-benzoquinol methylase
MLDTDKEWEKLGQTDPYYGVLSCDKFRTKKLDAAAIEEFFSLGDDHITSLFEIIRRYTDSEFAPSSALDFGCGVGRCTIPLARLCRTVVGVDVSDSMLGETAKNVGQRSISNVTLVKTDEMLSQSLGPFDFIHSVLVFQHIPPGKGEKLLQRLLNLLSNNGVLAIQFLYHRNEAAYVRVMGKLRRRVPILHNLTNLLYGKSFTEPLMEKNVYDINRLLFLLKNSECSNLHVRLLSEGSLDGMLLLCQKQRHADGSVPVCSVKHPF